jgi:hypothetical protein
MSIPVCEFTIRAHQHERVVADAEPEARWTAS